MGKIITDLLRDTSTERKEKNLFCQEYSYGVDIKVQLLSLALLLASIVTI